MHSPTIGRSESTLFSLSRRRLKVEICCTNSRARSAAVLMDCFLRAGGDFDESRTLLQVQSGTNAFEETLPFTVSHTFAAAGAITLTCNGFGGNYTAANAKISAVQVQSLTRTSG